MSDLWFALVIGNSRYHWARFVGGELKVSWDEDYWGKEGEGREREGREGGVQWKDAEVPLWVASVVPEEGRRWQGRSQVRWLTLADVPLQGMYPTLGIDRALAVWGAIATVGSPVLVIDAGTALTFTGADAAQTFVGGAISPGLRLQFAALHHQTAIFSASTATPVAVPRFELPPSRWAGNTEAAISSGILYTAIAGIHAFVQDWWQQYPGSSVVLTGGDSADLYRWWQQADPDFAKLMTLNPTLIFQGIQAIREDLMGSIRRSRRSPTSL